MQRGHPEVSKQFALNFDGIKTKVGALEFEVSEQSISTTTKIHVHGEKWFKAMSLNSTFSKEFLKPEYQGDNLSKGVPRNHMLEYFDKMLRVIQRYFTCEGRFNMVYQYHIRLLLHFTGKESLNLPFYLFRSIGKMSDRVQAKSKQVDTSVFHSGLIKMLVLEELKKTNTDWDAFLVASGFQPDVAHTPQSKRQTPIPAEKTVHSESSKKRKMTKRDKSIQSTDKIVEGPSQPPDEDTSPVAEPAPMGTSSSKARSLKGKKLVFSSPVVVEVVKPRRPFTRSTTKKHVSVEEGTSRASTQPTDKTKPLKKKIEIIEIKSPSDERDPTFKRLRKQLKEARDENEQLKKENLHAKIQLKRAIDMGEETIKKEKHWVKRSISLHRKMKNVYRLNRAHQAENRKLKEEVQQLKEQNEKQNLDMLA
jgi:hypothetical protein